MRKNFLSIAFFALAITFVSHYSFVKAQDCQQVFNPTYYEQVSNGPIKRDIAVPRGSVESAVFACSTGGCPNGSACIIYDYIRRPGNLPFFKSSPYEPGVTYHGYCQSFAALCCGTPSNGNYCTSSGSIGCCPPSANNTCYNPNGQSVGQCRYCADLSGGTCTDDSECCGTGGSGGMVCNAGTHACVPRPAAPAAASCDASKIANGETCDIWWYDGDNNYCTNCVSGHYEDTTDCGGGRCTKRCTPLANGDSCSSGANCACASGTCTNDASGHAVCSAAGSCINTFGNVCGATPCCTYIQGTRAICGASSVCQPDPNACINAIAGATCTVNADCCPGSTGLTCAGNVCTSSGSLGTDCFGYGQCQQSSCDFGQICEAGHCVASDDCIATTINKIWTNIVTFDDLIAQVYLFLYPVGIAIGVFFIGKSGYTIMMSEGNPAKIAEGKEELTAAVVGTFFIILSLVILRVIIKALLGATI